MHRNNDSYRFPIQFGANPSASDNQRDYGIADRCSFEEFFSIGDRLLVEFS
ncbi:hypothetical protein [cf. Phormidesmis sp. LEGE 11477]|uniref:hypothetical protein n=1 Tax=cf. Phormidesmis sp. LEGE 11477 TaxID=1828680 RepID=UPI00188113E2|nr:hypothetical protein [cf. Phormidesmis sp. LEGE 11477]MBE9063425.1 hypothetical protein [cf. Phormidesmis sp. LEGE 11477]